jgi:hypothetical protein
MSDRPYVIGCMLTYNSAATALAGLLSVANVVDHVIVLDGSFAGDPSCDGTQLQVSAFALNFQRQPAAQVEMVTVPGSLWEKRQAYIEMANKHAAARKLKGPVWVLQIDADEIYDDRINRLPWLLAQLPPRIATVGWRMHLFTRDLVHEERIEPNVQVRAYRLLPGLRFRHMLHGLEEMVDGDEAPLIAAGRTHWLAELAVFHYHGQLSMEEKERKLRQYLTWQGFDPANIGDQVRTHSMHFSRERWLETCVLPKEWLPHEHPWALSGAAEWSQRLTSGDGDSPVSRARSREVARRATSADGRC